MNPNCMKMKATLLAAGCLALWPLPSMGGPFSLISDSEKMTAVSSKVFNGYVRVRLPDGSFQRETYALGNGGLLDGDRAGADGAGVEANGAAFGAITVDDTIDHTTLDEMAKTIAGPLATQNYVPTPDAGATNLLIMVFWGKTYGSAGNLQGGLKDYIDRKNARLLGFDSESVIGSLSDHSAAFFGRSFNMGLQQNLHADVMSALEVNRYFVILRAFDFQLAWKQKKIKLLWETRFSLSERLHDFEKEVPSMAQYASTYFGQDTHGLLRSPVPEGHVEIGDVKSLGPVPDK
jgi:hypothetical protein